MIHPGDLAWWAYHSDPRTQGDVTYWLDDDRGFVVLGANNDEISAFCVPAVSPIPLLNWGREQLGPNARVGFVSALDRALETDLEANGYEAAAVSGPAFNRRLLRMTPPPVPTSGFDLRPMRGEKEADQRRRASHAAFKSTMDPVQHLERYLRFMRSPVYEAERDLVALTPAGTVAFYSALGFTRIADLRFWRSF